MPTLLGRPIPANHAAPRRRIVGATAIELDVVHRRRAAIHADRSRERRLQARHALLAFEALEQARLLAADIGAGAVVDDDVEVPAVLVVLPDQASLIRLVDRGLKMLALADELAAHVDERGVRPHGEARDEAALHERMRIVPHDLAILARARLGFIGVDHQIGRAAVLGFLRHEGPFQPGRESGAAAAAQARGLHLVDDRVAALFENRLGAIPRATLHGALQAPVMETVEIGEDAVLVGEHGSVSSSYFRSERREKSVSPPAASVFAWPIQSSRPTRPLKFRCPSTQATSAGVQAAIWS